MTKMTPQEAVERSISEDLDDGFVQDVLSKPPFISIDGVFNARTLSSDTLRAGYIFRSGSLERITEQGKQDIVALGIRRIFDLRSAIEFDAHPDPDIDGVELTPALTITDPALKGPAKYGSVGTSIPLNRLRLKRALFKLAEMYLDMLETHKNVWTDIFEHIRDHPEAPFLIHCTAGKDRTATVVVLIHGIARTHPKDIAHDYALTRIGVEPVKSVLLAKMTGGGKINLNTPYLNMVSDMSPNVMLSFLKLLENKYGSIDSYLRRQIKLEPGEIEQIRRNLRG